MSKLENEVATALAKANIQFECQNKMPLDDWPWKMPRSHKPKCDFFLPQASIYVEVKGFMTIHAMAKMSWLCRQKNVRYYILQGSETDWNPYLHSPLNNSSPSKRTVQQNIEQQIQELCLFVQHDSNDVSQVSLARLKDYIRMRIDEYTTWNGEWY